MSDAPSDIEALRAALAAAEARADAMTAEATRAKAIVSGSSEDQQTVRGLFARRTAMIALLKLEIEKLRRALYGHRSERKARLLDQLELQLEERAIVAVASDRATGPSDTGDGSSPMASEATATEDAWEVVRACPDDVVQWTTSNRSRPGGLAAEQAAAKAKTAHVAPRRHPVRKPFPEHLPRERVVIEAPCSCGTCGSNRIAKLGEDSEPLCAIGSRTMASETLEVIPRRWKVIQTVREKFTCRDCERIT